MGLVEAQISRHEQVERAILERAGWPTDLPTIYAILAGEQKAPGGRRTAARDRRRALHAMHTLGLLSQVRSHLVIGNENARLAVYKALVAVTVSNPAASGHLTLQNVHAASQKAAQGRGPKNDARLASAVASYRASNPEHSDRTMATNLAHRLGRKFDTVRGQIQRLKQNGSSTVGS